MLEQHEVTDSDLNAHTHKTEIKNLNKKVDDFEPRIRVLEQFKSEREGAIRAHLHWIGYAVLMIIQIVILLFREKISTLEM